MTQYLIAVGALGYPAGTPTEQVYQEIVQAGYQGTPVYPGMGTPEQAMDLLAGYGLKPAPGYIDGSYWLPGEREAFLEKARANAVFSRHMGVKEIFVAASGWAAYTGQRGLNRAQAAGWVAPEDGLKDEEWNVFCGTLAEACRIFLGEGVTPCFHSHVGSVIETSGEIERLLAEMPVGLLSLGPDTGQLAFAGINPVIFFREYASMIRSVHIKDVVESVRAQGAAERWDYDAFVRNGVYTELGSGNVDFPAIFTILEKADYQGALVVETDAPAAPTMLESNTLSRQYLKRVLGQ